MRPLIVNTFLTLDGVMQAPGGPEEDQEGGFDHGGWSVGYWDEAMGEKMGEFMGRPYDLLLGRKTYEIFAAHWPKVEAPEDGGLNAARKHVASRTLDAVEWSNSTLLEGDVGEAVAALKDEDGPEIQVHGSGNLLQTLLEHDLVDRLQLMIFPVVLGTRQAALRRRRRARRAEARRLVGLLVRRRPGGLRARGGRQVRLLRPRGAE